MNTDSTVVELGGFVIEHVKRSSTLTKDGKLITETISPLDDPQQIMLPVLLLYALFFILLALLIAFLGWYYLKKRNETARLMMENNMSPAILFGPNGGQKSISKSLRAGIILVALALALIVNDLFIAYHLARYSGFVFILVAGLTLILIHFLNSRKNKL
jgi:membrane protein implicated in regulation of membrane protease activity